MSRFKISDIDDDDLQVHIIPLENRVCDRCFQGEPVMLAVYGEHGHQFLCNGCMDAREKDAHQQSKQMLTNTHDA